jgi:hypothetical protein
MALSLGPGHDEIEPFRPVYLEHKDKFPPGTWAHEFFENGVDDGPPASDPADAVEDDTEAHLPDLR